MARIWYVDNDNVVTLDELTDEAGDYVNDATVEATLFDLDGDEVTGVTWPITLSYVAASDGLYRGVAGDVAAVADGAEYDVRVDVDDGSGGTARFWHRVVAKTRRG